MSTLFFPERQGNGSRGKEPGKPLHIESWVIFIFFANRGKVIL